MRGLHNPQQPTRHLTDPLAPLLYPPSIRSLNMQKSKPAVRRSACDNCRAKRTRCLRDENSSEPCARCSHLGEQCVTGAPGIPGRPPKRRHVDGDTTAAGPVASPSAVAPPARQMPYSVSAPQETHQPAQGGVPVEPSWDDFSHDLQPDFWGLLNDTSTPFGSPPIQQTPTLRANVPNGVDRMNNPSQPQAPFDAETNSVLQVVPETISAFDVQLVSHFAPPGGFLPSSPKPQGPNPVASLMHFREKMEQHITMVDGFYADRATVMKDCAEKAPGPPAENPTALLLACSTEFIDIIKVLTPTADTLGTETVLLVLSSYLALMRLFDALFHTIYTFICTMPPASFKSMKVKSVLRIGGMAALQDVPLKTYAMGVLDAIRGQVQVIEGALGIPTDHCLTNEKNTISDGGDQRMFSRPDRAQLFWSVLAQEDVKSRQGYKSYVEAIRANIESSVRLLEE